MRVIDNKVLILPHKPREVSDGGIVLVNVEEILAGSVVAVGPGLMNDDGSRRPMQVKPGDVVVYPKHAGAEMEVAGEKYKVMKESEIHLILQD